MLLCGGAAAVLAWAGATTDEVKSLPGLSGPLRSKLFSGYLKAQAVNQTFYVRMLCTL